MGGSGLDLNYSVHGTESGTCTADIIEATRIDFTCSCPEQKTISGKISGLVAGELLWIEIWSEATSVGGGTEVVGTGEDIPYEIEVSAGMTECLVSVITEGGCCPSAHHVDLSEGSVTGIDFTCPENTISVNIKGACPNEVIWIDSFSETTSSGGGIEIITDSQGNATGEIKGLPPDTTSYSVLTESGTCTADIIEATRIDFTCSCPPTLITLASFTANYDNTLALEWQTASEIDNAGFNIWQSDTEDGQYVRINDKLIPAKGSPIQGAADAYQPSGTVPGRTHHYKLEDVDLGGVSTFHGPISVTLTESGVLLLSPKEPGDLNGHGNLTLADAVMALRVTCGLNLAPDHVLTGADTNGDGKIGLQEVIYVLQKVAEIR